MGCSRLFLNMGNQTCQHQIFPNRKVLRKIWFKIGRFLEDFSLNRKLFCTTNRKLFLKLGRFFTLDRKICCKIGRFSTNLFVLRVIWMKLFNRFNFSHSYKKLTSVYKSVYVSYVSFFFYLQIPIKNNSYFIKFTS